MSVRGQGISSSDSEEIKQLARRKVERSLKDFLNVLTHEDLEESRRIAIIRRNLADSIPNRLFYNADVIIVDDLEPDRPIDQPKDLKIEKYLANLDLFYAKTAEPTITFSDVKVSSVKERVYPYVKVFFTETFTGKNNQSTATFRPVPRVAEVRAQRHGKKWSVMIAQIEFPQPGDSVNSPINNVVLVEPETPVDSAALEAQKEKQALVNAQRAKDLEQEAMAQKVYESYLARGEQAIKEKDLQGALLAFQEAEKRNTNREEAPSVRIAQVKRMMNASKIAERELFREYSEKADIARKKRQYAEALSYYHKILAKTPDSVALVAVVKDLTQKSSIKTEYDEQYAAGQYEALIDAYDKVIKKDPNNSDWYLGRARSYLKLNKDDRALRDLTKSIELDYANLAALQTRGELYRKLNNLPKSIADYSAYLIIDPKNDNLFWQRALMRIGTNNLSSADEDFTQAINLNNKQAIYVYDRGLLRFRGGRNNEALNDFSKAIDLSPTKPESYFWRGLLYAIQKQYTQTGADFDAALKYKVPDQLAARIDSVSYSLYSMGKQANEVKEYDQAVRYLTDALAVRSTFPRALYERGLAYLKKAAYPQAIENLTASLVLAPAEATTLDRRAEAYMAQGRYDLAAADYSQSNKLVSTNYTSLLGEATALIELKKFTEAIPPLMTIKTAQKKIDKTYSPIFFRDALYQLGVCEDATGQYDKAVDDYSSVINLDKTYALAYFNRGAAYESLGKLDRAVADYQQAVSQSPGIPKWQFAKARALERKGDFQEAIAAYGDVIKADTSKALYMQTVLRRGMSYYAAGQYNEALSDLNVPASQPDPGLCGGDCWMTIGLANLYSGKPDTGLPYLAKCLPLPDYKAQAAYATACAYLQKENEAEALVWFEKALQDRVQATVDIRKDKLIDVAKKDYRRSKSFRQLVDKYPK